MVPGWSLETSVYARLLRREGGDIRQHPLRHPLIVADTTATHSVPTSSQGFLAGHWPNDVKASFDSAFVDLARQSRATRPVSPQAVRELDLQVGMARRECEHGDCEERVAQVWLSAVGFNGDSTYAVAYRGMVCGGLCGTGVVFLLRRNPGAEWTVWHARLMWIS